MTRSVSVQVLPDGPLKISSEELDIRYCGESLDVEPGQDVFLCRCGESKNAPFCDGSHSSTGFVAEEPAKPDKAIRVWEGRTIQTFFNPKACMHVFYCKPLKELREKELAGDDEAADEIARVVRTCPSGALSYEVREGAEVAKPSSPDSPAIDIVEGGEVRIVEGGEVRIRCEFEIDTELHERQYKDRATLCRCGLSTNKPWCDGRHRQRDDFR